MSGFFTDKEQIHPSIYIQKTQDFTERMPIRERGQVACMAYVAMGNPLLPITVTESYSKTKSTDIDARNRSLFYLKDFWMKSEGRATNISRILGFDSTIKTIKLVGGAIDTDEVLKIYQDGTMNAWEDIATTAPLELLLKFCPEEEVTLILNSTDGRIELEIKGMWGDTIYKVSGFADINHINTDGDSDYIGNIANCNYITVKSDASHADYQENYQIVEKLSPLCENLGDDTHTFFHEKNLRTIMQQSDYFMSAGIGQSDLLAMANKVRLEFSCPQVIDLISPNIDEAITKKNNLGFTDENTLWLWSRTKYVFKSGVQNIGLSGYFLGLRVLKNLSSMHGVAENRVDAVAFARSPILRTLSCGLEPLSKEEKDKLVLNRINTVETYKNKLIISDVLSGTNATSHLTLMPTADGFNWIKRQIGEIIEFEMGANLTIAKSNVENRVRVLFEDCWHNKFFDNDVNQPYTFKISDRDNSIFVVNFKAVMEGVTRKGEVQASILGS